MGDPTPSALTDVGPRVRANGRAGLSVGNWTVRWTGDCWSVGRWSREAARKRRWREATWYGRLDQALARLHDNLIRDGFEQVVVIADLCHLIARSFDEIEDALSALASRRS